MKVAQTIMEMELCPLSYILNRTLDLLFARDTEELFHEPVDADEVMWGAGEEYKIQLF